MSATRTFDQLLDDFEGLAPEEQAELAAVIQRRLAERGRRRVAEDVKEARAEFANGKCRPTSVDDLKREIES